MHTRSIKIALTGILLSFGSVALMPAALAEPASGDVKMDDSTSPKPGKSWKQGKKKFKGGHHRGKWMADLDLSVDQKAKMKDIKKKSRDQVKTLREDMRAKHQALRVLMTGDGTPDAIRAAHKDAEAVRQKLDDLQFETMLEIRGILTPAQRQKFGDSMGPGGPRGQGPDGPGPDSQGDDNAD